MALTIAAERLQDGLMGMVELLAEMQDNTYSLDGLRERARKLLSGWTRTISR